MVVISPCDSIEAKKATLLLFKNNQPTYLRLTRAKTPVITTVETPFEIGKAYVLKEGHDVSLLGTGTMTYQLLVAAKILETKGIHAEVVHVPTIKPLDEQTILASARKTGRVVTAEEAQAAGGFGSAVTEFLSSVLPMPIKRIGIEDRFGESGAPSELMEYFGLTGEKLVPTIEEFIDKMPRYHQA
jgi:transketolase